jgi:dTDP-4-amino-4,6-dideoxygalactose transaminase
MIKYLDLKAINAQHDAEMRAAISGVLDSGWYLRGMAVQRFEQHYAHYIGTCHCIGCGNGLDALKLILQAYMEMGVMQKGDEVIVPANTYIASILAITECGLTPVLVEPSIDTLQIDDALIEAAITPRTKAIMIVHLYGRCAYTPRIGELCRSYGLKLIEDNAQAHGCTYNGMRTGALGDAAAHSFYPGKNLGALGDAGAVTANSDELAEIVRALGNYGSTSKYVFDYQGCNSRMDELQAAVLDVKLHYLDGDNQIRKEIAARYEREVINPLMKLRFVGNETVDRSSFESCDSVYHIFPVFCESRHELQQYLSVHGVETQIHYPIPPHKQMCYKEWRHLSFPITEQIHAQELSIPCNQSMTQKEVDEVINLLNTFTLA